MWLVSGWRPNLIYASQACSLMHVIACVIRAQTLCLSVCPALLFGSPVYDLGLDIINYPLNSACLLTTDWTLTTLNLACFVPGLLLNHSASLPIASTCLLCSVCACLRAVARHHSIVSACHMGKGAATGKEHKS